MDLMKLCQSVLPDVTAWRHHIHANPELSGHETETSAFVEEKLKSFGVDELRRVGKNGVTALIRGKNSTPVIGLRADMDALPVPEHPALPFCSRRENTMHACGHDVHTAVLLGTAKVLCAIKSELNGTVKLFFQPAEEICEGARMMIETGEFDREPLDCVAALHTYPFIPAGTLGIRHGATNASSDRLEITIRGRQGHGAYPDKCIDPVPAAAQVITALQEIVSREIPPQDSAVITIGTIHAGLSNNIIAPEVKMTGTVRSLKPLIREQLFEAIPRVTDLTARSMRCTAEVTLRKGPPVLLCNDTMVDHLLAVAETTVGKENIVHLESSAMGGEDFAYFTERVPGVMFRLGTGYPGRDNPPLHSSDFEVDENCFICGVSTLASLALDLCSSFEVKG